MKNTTYIFHKPYDVLSQFTKEHVDHVTLADFLEVESDVYPVGRLDRDSEGLLLLSNDKELINRILHPSGKKYKTYIVQLEGQIDEPSLSKLRNGVKLRINKKEFVSAPAKLKKTYEPENLAERVPPIRKRLNIPTSWVEISITEGKNRQVRKMFASVGFPVLRLIRTKIAEYEIADLKPGKYRRV